uniref:Uncharacterized protein n=1 Tax=Spermophilus dauricus TaxID=99837 RepID=A0A8C9QMM6_SPEDA
MSGDRTKSYELNQEKFHADDNLKIIYLGPNAVGKSKLMERFLMNGFQLQQTVPRHAHLLLPQGPCLHHHVQYAE